MCLSIYIGLGFTIRGGVDYVHVPDDPGIFVTSVKQNGAAARDGRLKPGDKILEVWSLNYTYTHVYNYYNIKCDCQEPNDIGQHYYIACYSPILYRNPIYYSL